MPPACMPAHPVPPLTGDANSDFTSSEQILVPSAYDPAITAQSPESSPQHPMGSIATLPYLPHGQHSHSALPPSGL